MIEEKEIIILTKSIKMLDKFYQNIESVNSGREYITIRNRNIETIKKIANDRNSVYIKKKIENYPKIKAEEIDTYIKFKKQEIGLFNYIFVFFTGFIYLGLIDIATFLFKSKGSTFKQVKSRGFKSY